MSDSAAALTPALEDYLETIYLVVRDRKLARVRDISETRGVKPGSVVPALRRLASMGLIRYEQRELIDLTPEGEAVARRTLARHELLRRFLQDILGISPAVALADACAMEHYLSDGSVDRLTRFFEYIQRCPRGQTDFIDRFHRCPVVNPGQPECEHRTQRDCLLDQTQGSGRVRRRSLATLRAGQEGVVARVAADAATRSRLLDLGLLPGTKVVMERNTPGPGSLRVGVNGRDVAIGRKEASCVVLV